jgi:hypothetical protein
MPDMENFDRIRRDSVQELTGISGKRGDSDILCECNQRSALRKHHHTSDRSIDALCEYESCKRILKLQFGENSVEIGAGSEGVNDPASACSSAWPSTSRSSGVGSYGSS